MLHEINGRVLARVVQWQNTSFPSWIWGFDSPLSLIRMKKILFPFYFTLLTFLGCASVPPVPPVPKTIVQPQMPGTYHRVEKGQTLWRISRIYGAGLDELITVNRITDTSNISVGERIFIPDYLKKSTGGKIGLDDFSRPIAGKTVLGFGQTSKNRLNRGIDIAPLQNHNIYAARAGKIIFLSPDFAGFRQAVIIDHNDGFQTVYSGNLEPLVKLGDSVAKGALIAKIKGGNNYLHFEIRKNGLAQNPNFYLTQ